MAGPWEQYQEKTTTGPWTAYDAPRSDVGDFFASIQRGVLSGLASTASAGGQAAEIEMGQPVDVPSGPETTDIIEQNVTGELPKPQRMTGRFGETVGEFIGSPASYVGPGGLPAKIATTVTSALGSEALGELTAGTAAEPYARLVGAVLGGQAPRGGLKAAAGMEIPAERQAALATLRGEGVTPTAGQATGSRALHFAESQLGDLPGAGGAATAANERTLEEFTRASLRRVGEDADRATPEVVDRAFTRIGRQFDDLAARNSAVRDRQFVKEILDAQAEYQSLVPEGMRKPVVDKLIEDALSKVAKNQTMAGEEYKALRSRIERVRRSSGNDPELRITLAEIRDAMDNLMERSIAATNPSDSGAWREVRNQYRNMLVIERAVSSAGESAAQGIVTPAKLRQGVVSQDKRSYARGAGEFADLARSGEAILKPLPSSGTSERLAVMGIPAATAATLSGGSPYAIPAVLAPGIGGRLLLSRPVQRYLMGELPGQAAASELLEQMPDAASTALRSAAGESGRSQ